jgi:hypothetical protein
MAELNLNVRIDEPAIYQIVLQGRLSQEWSNWLEGMTVASESSGDGPIMTTLSGTVVDQAHLYGLLSQIRDLSLPLLRVEFVGKGDVSMKPESSLLRYPSRLILEGVSRAGYDVHLSPFPGSLYAILEYIGDPCDYDYIMGVSGAAFRRLWNRDDGGNIGILHYGDEPFRRILEALGYGWRKIPVDKEAMIQAVKESLNRNVPVISFGILGPPEAGVVAGYDQDGQVLYGWSYFQENGDKYYEKNDWFESMIPMMQGSDQGLIVLEAKKHPRPEPRQVLVQSLEWALDLEKTSQRPGVPDHTAGLAAYESWAEAMEVDEDYPGENKADIINRLLVNGDQSAMKEILSTRLMVHGDQAVMLEERHSAAGYLRKMIPVAPEAAAPLEAAAALYDEIGSLVSRVYPWAPWHEQAFRELPDPKLRREFARLVRLAKEKETLAVTHLERALACLI